MFVPAVQFVPVHPELHVPHVTPLLVLEHVHTLGALQAPLFWHVGLHSAVEECQIESNQGITNE